MISGSSVTIRKGHQFRPLNEYPEKILITSVPHSGTQFFHRLIKPTAFTHVSDKSRIFSLLDECPVVLIAIRHPQLVWESWWHRREGLNDDKTGPGLSWYETWKYFKKVIDYENRKETFFLPIDHPSRDERLKLVSERLGKPFIPNWDERVNQRNRDRGEPPPIDLTEILEIPIMRELYASQSGNRTQ